MEDEAPQPWLVTPGAPQVVTLRPRVDTLLDQACQASPVVAVTAGAGYGKTTALSAWARHLAADRPVAWVDARMASRAPGGLWQALRLACHRAVGPAGDDAEPAADRGAPAAGVFHVIDLLNRSSRQPAVILDDVHDVTDRAALESLDLLIAYLPPGTNLVIASRWDPPLRLAGLRLAERLSEVRTCDLAFEAAETQQLLDAHGVNVDDATSRWLTQAADGWPIALRLAATAMAAGANVDHALAEVAGHEGRLARYLGNEVLDRLPPNWREVLTTVSIAERFHGDLAVALTDVPDAGAIVEQAAAETGLFHPLPGEPGWLEAHPLARSFLRIELETARGADIGDLHHRAATWFAAQGDWGRAMEHALSDPHSACLADIIAQVDLDPLLRSTPKGQRVAARVARTAPARWPLGRPLALAVAVLANTDARAAFGVSEALRHTRFAVPQDERLRVVALARVWRNLGRNDLAAAVLHDASWEGATTDELVLLRAEQVLAGCDGAGYDVIREHAADALALAETCEADRLVVHLRVALAALALIEGDPRQAREYVDSAALLGALFGQDLAIPLAEARVIRTVTALEFGEGDLIGSASLTPLTSVTRGGPVHLRLAAAGLDLRQRWAEGEHPRQLLRQIPEVLAGVDLEAADPGFVLSIVELELLLAEAAQDLACAEAAVRRLPARYQDHPEAAYLRAHLHRIRRAYGQARRELRPAVRREVAPLWPAMRLRILVLDGVLAGLQGASDTASLQEAVEIASGRKRPFLELGPAALRVLVARRNALSSEAGFVDAIISDLERMAPGSLPEPLTPAEVTVLRRLASMATLEEIAEGLHLSRNTIKTHASSVYRKLDVGSRREAVARGRELGLLRSQADGPT